MSATKTPPLFYRTFQAHPDSVDESYTEHAGVALSFALQLFLAAFAALIHALVPCLFEKTASRIIKKLHTRMERR